MRRASERMVVRRPSVPSGRSSSPTTKSTISSRSSSADARHAHPRLTTGRLMDRGGLDRIVPLTGGTVTVAGAMLLLLLGADTPLVAAPALALVVGVGVVPDAEHPAHHHEQRRPGRHGRRHPGAHCRRVSRCRRPRRRAQQPHGGRPGRAARHRRGEAADRRRRTDPGPRAPSTERSRGRRRDPGVAVCCGPSQRSGPQCPGPVTPASRQTVTHPVPPGLGLRVGVRTLSRGRTPSPVRAAMRRAHHDVRRAAVAGGSRFGPR